MSLTADGNWYEIVSSVPASRPALFLDRDGVVIEERDYLHDPASVKLLPGVAPVIRDFRDHGFDIILITNQSGIGRGYFSWDRFFAVQAKIRELLSHDDAGWDMALACPYHPTQGVGDYRRENPWRKPNPGMITFAADTLGINLARSVLVGDKLSDLEAGKAASVGLLCHVETGHGAAARPDVLAWAGSVVRLRSLANLTIPEWLDQDRSEPRVSAKSPGSR